MTRAHVLRWSPRILGVAVGLFVGMFALDAFSDGMSVEAVRAFAIHLIPALIVLGAVVAAWRWEWIGGVAFSGLAIAYTYYARHHLSWVVVIAGPLLIVGLLFFWSWLHHDELQSA